MPLPVTLRLQSSPETLRWPRACVCCGGIDERNLEIAVPSTQIDEHERDVIMEVELPYCLECFDHAQSAYPLWRVVAIFLVLFLATLFSASIVAALAGQIILGGSVIYAFYLAAETLRYRGRMKPGCTGARAHVVFTHPTTTGTSTVTFSNPRFARDFADLNRFHIIAE